MSTGTLRTPRGRPSLAGPVAAGAGGLLFAALLLLVRARWAPLESVDHGLATDLNSVVADNQTLLAVLRAVTRLGSNAVLWWLVAIATVVLLLRRRFRLAGYLVVTGIGALVLDPTLKLAVGRLRPVVPEPVAHGQGNSFPSGHALGSTICYGALLLVFLPALPRRWRRPAVLAVGVLVLLIGLSRIMLGVHYLSDVVGAWGLGVAWLGVTAYAFERWRLGTGERVTAPLHEGLEPEAARDLKPTDAPPTRPDAPPSRLSQLARAAAGTAVAWVLVFGAVTGFGVLVTRYGNGDVLGDRTVPHALAAHRTAALDRVSYFWSEAGNTHAILAVGLVTGAVALAVARRWRPVVFLLVLMFGELTLFLAAAAVVGRPRPDVPHLDPHLPTSSYPSGHVAATTCLYVAIVILVPGGTGRWWRRLALVPAIAMPILVALSRMYRGMHHPTDILGGLLLAACWLAATYLAIRPNADLAGRRTAPGPVPRPARVPAGHPGPARTAATSRGTASASAASGRLP